MKGRCQAFYKFFLQLKSSSEMVVFWQECFLRCPEKHPSLNKSPYNVAVILAWEELIA